MRVRKLVFALISPTHQAAPGSVQLSTLLLNIIHSLRVGLNQTLSHLPQRVDLGRDEETSKTLKSQRKQSLSGAKIKYLISQSCQVSLEAFMFALQCLNTGQVMTVVVSVEGLVFFFNPFFGFISISEDTNEKIVF